MDTGFIVAELCGMSREHISARAAPGAIGVPGLTRLGHSLCTVLPAPPPSLLGSERLEIITSPPANSRLVLRRGQQQEGRGRGTTSERMTRPEDTT